MEKLHFRNNRERHVGVALLMEDQDEEHALYFKKIFI